MWPDDYRIIAKKFICVHMNLFFNRKKYSRENWRKNVKESVTRDENDVYRRYLFSPLIERGPSFSVARFTAAATIDHNERIVTWINSLRDPENVFSRRDYRRARERGSTIIRRRMNWAQRGANISGGGVFIQEWRRVHTIPADFILRVFILRSRVPGFRVY